MSPGRLPSVIVLSAAGLLFAGRAAADPSTKQECVIANETAQDLQRSGKLVEARTQLLTCAASACPAAVRMDCADQLQAVDQLLPTVVFLPKDAGAVTVGGASLAVDGVPLAGALDGTPVAVNPGLHTFTIGLTDQAPVVLRLVLRGGERLRREVVVKAAAPGATPARAEGGAQASTAGVSAPSAEPGGLTTRRMAWTAIGAGAAGVTLGTLFGFLALGRKSSLKNACDGSLCPQAQEDDIEALHVNAVASNVSFLIGVLGLGAGGVLLFAFPDGFGAETPRAESGLVVRPWVGLGGLGAAGRFH